MADTDDIASLLARLVRADQERFSDDHADEPLFDAPMPAIASADDPWFARFKSLIGPHHWTPAEALAMSAPGATARSVISWCLPVSERSRRDNRGQDYLPARSWARVRTFGEELNSRLRRRVVEALRQMGCKATAPGIAEPNTVRRAEGVGLSSCWSERHVAFVAGLGTFGISGGLITRRGIAHRLGSVVTDLELPATPREYGEDPFAWCLKTARGTCGACIARCPVGSIGCSADERDKEACYHHTMETVSRLGPEQFGWQGVYGCGLCQTGVPCEFRNPLGLKGA